jgi:hypothetical protein
MVQRSLWLYDVARLQIVVRVFNFFLLQISSRRLLLLQMYLHCAILLRPGRSEM